MSGDPLSHSFTRFIDGAGRVLSTTDVTRRTTRYEYDPLNQLKKVIDPQTGTTSFEYDPNGNLLSVTYARDKVTGYTYDPMDRVKTRTDPLQGATSVVVYGYDEAGNLKKLTDRRGKVTTYDYDHLNRLKFAGFGTTVSGGVTSYESSITYTRDAYGRITQAADTASGAITRVYDDLTRTWSETTPQGAVGYSYDAASRMTGKTIAGQSAISYAYDAADRLTGITQGASVVGFGYDDADRRTSLTLPNSVVTEYGYDDASQLTLLTYKRGGVTLGDLSYGYYGAGRRTKAGGSFARTLLPQALSSATHDGANRLVQREGIALVYDAEGNLTSDGVNAYTWDARGQLASISGTVTASFRYDAFGRRVGKTVGGQETSYLYDGANVVREQVGGASTELLNGGLDEVFLRADVSGTGVLLTDGLGSSVALSDAGGALRTQYTYDPFGSSASAGGPSGNPSQYTGRENDGTGLYYYRARYYSPALQRFISEDPIGFAGGDINFYSYVTNDPINNTDPSGMSIVGKLVKKLPVRGKPILGKGVDRADAADAVRNGGDVMAKNRRNAEEIARAADREGSRPVHDEAHPAAGEGARPHYHPFGRRGGHAFYSVAAFFAPFTIELSGRKDTTAVQFGSAMIWDVAGNIHPVGVTEGLNWYFGLEGDEE